MKKFKLYKYLENNDSSPIYSVSSRIELNDTEPNKFTLGVNNYATVDKLKAYLFIVLNKSFLDKSDLSFTFTDYTDTDKSGILYFEKIGIFEENDFEKEMNLFENFLIFLENIK